MTTNSVSDATDLLAEIPGGRLDRGAGGCPRWRAATAQLAGLRLVLLRLGDGSGVDRAVLVALRDAGEILFSGFCNALEEFEADKRGRGHLIADARAVHLAQRNELLREVHERAAGRRARLDDA